MERVLNESATKVGVVESLIFDGPAPSLDELHRIIYDGATHDRLVSHVTTHNRLNDRAIAASAAMWVDQYVKTPSRIKLGTGAPPSGQTGPLTTDEDCWTPDNTTIRDCDVKTTFLTIYSEFGVTYDTNEINDTTYTEALLTDSDGKAWAHVYLASPLTKSSNQTAVLLWKVQNQGS